MLLIFKEIQITCSLENWTIFKMSFIYLNYSVDILGIVLFKMSERIAYNYSIVYSIYILIFIIHFLISILLYI